MLIRMILRYGLLALIATGPAIAVIWTSGMPFLSTLKDPLTTLSLVLGCLLAAGLSAFDKFIRQARRDIENAG